MLERQYKHAENMNAEELRAIERAIMAAIGWVGGATNEGNHHVSAEIVWRLTTAAKHYERAALKAPAPTLSDKAARESD